MSGGLLGNHVGRDRRGAAQYHALGNQYQAEFYVFFMKMLLSYDIFADRQSDSCHLPDSSNAR